MRYREGEIKMPKLINEKELCEIIGISRHTAYYWRLQGMPYNFAQYGIYRYLYDLLEVKKWAKEHNKKIMN